MTAPTRRRNTLTALFLGSLVVSVIALPDELRFPAIAFEAVLFFAGAALHYREERDRLQTFVFWGPAIFDENEELKAANMRLAAELEDAQDRLHDAETVLVPLVSFANPSTRPNVTSIQPVRVSRQPLRAVPKQRGEDS